MIFVNREGFAAHKNQSKIQHLEEVIKTPKRSVIPRSKRQRDYVKSLKTHQIVMSLGPAGTGKTYLAKELAKQLTGEQGELRESECRKLIQFHPSYSYEDFVRGISVDSNNNIYITGGTYADFDGNSRINQRYETDNFIVKFDKNGNKQWSKQFGTGGYDEAADIVITKWDSSLTLTFQSGYPKIYKFNANGSQM